MDKKYFFFDIDGTITDYKSEKISELTIDTLKRLQEKGHFVAIATGRPYFSARYFAKVCRIYHMICEGGNGIVINDELIEYEPLEQDEIKLFLKQAEEAGFGVAVSTEDNDIRYTSNDLFLKQTKVDERYMKVIEDKNFDYMMQDTIRRVFVSAKKSEEHRLDMRGYGYMRYGDDFLIIEPDDKYKGIEKMMKLIGGDVSQVVVFGDGYNDRKMFKKAPLKIAMGNAVEELKEMADFVTHDSDEDGILYACEHFGWL